MNKELVNHLRLESGISRTADGQYLVCINKEGNIIDPLVGLQIFAKLVVEECVGLVDNTFWSDPHEVDQAMELILKHFGVK